MRVPLAPAGGGEPRRRGGSPGGVPQRRAPAGPRRVALAVRAGGGGCPGPGPRLCGGRAPSPGCQQAVVQLLSSPGSNCILESLEIGGCCLRWVVVGGGRRQNFKWSPLKISEIIKTKFDECARFISAFLPQTALYSLVFHFCRNLNAQLAFALAFCL